MRGRRLPGESAPPAGGWAPPHAVVWLHDHPCRYAASALARTSRETNLAYVRPTRRTREGTGRSEITLTRQLEQLSDARIWVQGL